MKKSDFYIPDQRFESAFRKAKKTFFAARPHSQSGGKFAKWNLAAEGLADQFFGADLCAEGFRSLPDCLVRVGGFGLEGLIGGEAIDSIVFFGSEENRDLGFLALNSVDEGMAIVVNGIERVAEGVGSGNEGEGESEGFSDKGCKRRFGLA